MKSTVTDVVMDAGLIVGIILLVPMVILIVGAPIVVVVRLLLEIVQRF